jgi:hypothetical protein
VKRIITSGPHTRASVRSGSKRVSWISRVTTPTRPAHVGPAWSTVTFTSRPRPAHAPSSRANSIKSGERAPTRTDTFR